MRSLILVISAIFVLSLGFLVYWWTSGTRLSGARHQESKMAATLPFRRPGQGFTADGVWVSRYNEKTGDLASRFRALQYEPQPDGRVKVIAPIAEFFLYDKDSIAKDPNRKGLDRTGRRLEISGRSGIVDMPRSERGKDNFGQTESTQSPTSGNLYDVTVRMFDQLEGGRQTLIVTMNNASFDNETFRIATEAFTDPATHQKVAWDQVPVKLRGDDYDLDGRGLTIKWNDRDRRLQLLEIQHGQTLVLKRPQQFMGASPSASPTVKPVSAPPATTFVRPSASGIQPLLDQPALSRPPPARWRSGKIGASDSVLSPLGSESFGASVILAEDATTGPIYRPRTARPPLPSGEASSPGRVGRTAPVTRPKITSDNEPPLYRATFFDDVHVVQDELELVSADRLLVDFLMNGDDSDSDDAAATRPAVNPSTQSGDSASTQPAPATQGASSAVIPHSHRKPARSDAAASTQPGQSPVTVHWTGKLQVVPLHLDEPLPPNEEVLTFEGAPVIAHQQGSEIRCARLTYHTEDGLTLLDSANPATPVILTKRDAQGISTVHASSVTYYRNQHVAVMHNAGRADLPVQAQGDSLARIMRATWSKSCTIHFIGRDENQMVMDTADLEGDVDVKHPQMKLQSQALALTFEPTQKNPPALKSTTQPGIAAATSLAPSNNLAGPVRMPPVADSAAEGVQASLRKMVATGKVHCDMSSDPANKQIIDCDRLTVLTVNDADGRIVPRTVAAEGDVHTIDPNEELHSQHLFATVSPSTRPVSPHRDNQAAEASSGQAVELQSLTASQDVQVTLKDGTRAYADTLLVGTRDDGKRTVKLLGAPLAKILSRDNTIIGAIISIFPDGQQLAVDGPGEMDGVQQDNPASPGRPIKVLWASSVWYDGKANVLDCLGNVVATSTDADGTHNRATGQQMRINFVEAATTKPSTNPSISLASTQPAAGAAGLAQRPATTQPTQPPGNAPLAQASAPPRPADLDDPLAAAAASSPPAPSTRPASAAADPTGISPASAPSTAPIQAPSLFTGKAIHDITFTDNAEVRSTLLDSSGKLLRLVDLFADKVTYEIDSQDGKPVRHINVPVPGKMLFEDHRPATQPATPAPGQPPNPNDDTNSRGATAFKWTRSMTYDDASQKMYMEGIGSNSETEKVIVDHRDDAPNAQPTRISALEVIADVVPVAAPATAPAQSAPSASAPAQPASVANLPATEAAPPDPLTARINASNALLTSQPVPPAATHPSTRPAGTADEMRMQVKFITAHGNVVLNAKGSEMHADRMNYDPIRHWVKAFGSTHYPAIFTQQSADDEHPPAQVRAAELDWDMQQDLPHAIGADAVLRK